MSRKLILNENLFEGIVSNKGKSKLSKYLKEDSQISIQDKFNYLKSYPTYDSSSGKAYTRPCKVWDLGLTDEQTNEFFKFLEDGGLEAFWNAHEYDSLNIYQEGRMGGHLILDPQIVDPYVFDEFDSYEEYLQDYLDSNYYPDLETLEGDLEYSSEQIENATSEVNSEISGAYDALVDFDNRVDTLIRDLKGTLDLRIDDPDDIVENLNESIQEVKNILQPLVTKDGKVRVLKDNEKLPRGFQFKSGNSTSGEVKYKGTDYAYAVVNGKLKVMTSTEAGDNWSETIYKESIENAYQMFIETIEEYADEHDLDLDNLTEHNDIIPEAGDYYRAAVEDLISLGKEWKGYFGKISHTVLDDIKEMVKEKLGIGEILKKLKDNATEYLTESLDNSKVVYHGTNEEAAKSILQNGFTKNPADFSDDEYDAQGYGYYTVKVKNIDTLNLYELNSQEVRKINEIADQVKASKEYDGIKWRYTRNHPYQYEIYNLQKLNTLPRYLDEDQPLNEKKNKQITADDIYQALEKVGYHNIYANSKGDGYYISKRSEKNLQKAKDILDQYGINYNVKPSQDRFYLNMEFTPEQLAESAEARDLEETNEIDEIIAQLKDDGYELDTDQDILQGLGADLGYDKEEQIKLLKAIKSRLSDKLLNEEFNQSEIDFIFSSKDEKYPYMILSRLKSDCDYYLGAGNKTDKHLWALNPKDQIAYMRAIYDRLEEKPEWLTSEQIDEYEKKMIDNSLTESTSDVSDLLDKAYNGSYYTIIGAGGDLQEWKNGYQELLNKENIGTIKEWITFTGSDMNTKYNLTGDNAYPNDLTFLAFPLDGLNIGKLAMFKLRMEDRWFDDIVDNNKSFNESYSSRLQKLSLNETFKVVDKNGKKVPQGGGFTSKKEAEMFAAQYGEKDLKVVSESFEDEHLGEVSKKEFTVTAVDKNGSTYLGRIKAKDNKEAEDKFAKEKGSGYKILGSHETTPDEIRKGVRLIEDIEMIPETPQTDSAMGIAGVINNLIIDEFEAIDGYNSAIITAEKEGITDIVDVLKDIVNEENIHVGQLQTCLTKVSPNAQSIDDGQVEAQQQLDNVNQTQATQEVTEAFDVEKVKKRIARVGEFDNGYVLFKYEPISSAEAEERAKQMSLKYPDDTYYVAYDNVMEPMSSIKWRNGQQVKE